MKELEDFEQEMRFRSLSEKTIHVYLVYLKAFFDFAKKPQSYIIQKDVRNFIQKGAKKRKVDEGWEQREYSITAKLLILSILKQFFKFTKRPEVMEGLVGPKKPKTLPRALEKKQVRTLFETKVQKRKGLPERNRLIMEFMYATGCRVSEVSNLKKSDLELDTKPYTARVIGKGSKDRIVVLGEKWIINYKQYLKTRIDESPYVFVNCYGGKLSVQSLQYIVHLASVTSGVMISPDHCVSPHKFRSTFATHTYDDDPDLVGLQERLGHEGADTTKQYTKITKNRFKKMRSPLDSL